MSKNIKYLDILGINPILYSNSSKRKTTIFGGIMSILTVVICSTAIIYFFLEVFLRSSYTIIYNQSTNLNPVLNFSKIPYAFTVADGEGRHIQNFENQIRIYAEYAYMYPDQNSTEIVVIKRQFMKLDKCKIEDFGEFKYLYKNYPNIEQFFCLPIDKFNFTIYGTFSDSQNPNSMINIRITKCFNDPNKGDLFPYVECFNRTFIDKNLANIFFNSLIPEYDINHSEAENPGKFILRSDTMQLTSTIFNRYYVFKKVVNYFSDFGFIFSNPVKQIYFQSDSITHMTDFRVNTDQYGLFGLITLSLSKKTDFYWRNYVKFQTALANIGGIVEGIFFICSFFVKLIMKKNYFYELGKSHLGIDVENYKEIKHEKIYNESVSSQVDINPSIRKNSDFKIESRSLNVIGSNLKKINQNIINYQKNKQSNLKNNKNDLIRTDYNMLSSNQIISKNKTDIQENGIFKLFLNRKHSKFINQRLEKIVRKELSVENLLKIINLVETIEKDLVDKKIIEKNSQSYLHEKIQILYINQNKDNRKNNKIENQGKEI